jgi:hypothetical protein
LATLFGLAFLGVFLAWAKLGCEAASRQRRDSSSPGLTRRSMEIRRTLVGPNCTRPFSMDHRVKPGGDEERTSGHGAATTRRHAKLSGAAHARRVAGAPIARAQRFGPACAVRFVGIVPLLRQQAVPPRAHMLRRRPGGVRLEALVPQEGQAQDAAAGMEPARGPEIVVTPAAAKPAPPRSLRRGVRSAISGWFNNFFAAVAR